METARTLDTQRDTDALRTALRSLQEDGITFAEISKATEVHRTAISQLVDVYKRQIQLKSIARKRAFHITGNIKSGGRTALIKTGGSA